MIMAVNYTKHAFTGFEQLSILKYDPTHGNAYTPVPVNVCCNSVHVAVLQNDANKSSVRNNKEEDRWGSLGNIWDEISGWRKNTLQRNDGKLIKNCRVMAVKPSSSFPKLHVNYQLIEQYISKSFLGKVNGLVDKVHTKAAAPYCH